MLARSAAEADAAATLVANAVNADHFTVCRVPACELSADSDLGELPVTTAVGPLPRHLVEAALDSGLELAASFKAHGLLQSAYLSLQNRTRTLSMNSPEEGALPCQQIDAIR